MEPRIPTDLIRRLQLSLRSQAGLPAYNPDDSTLPAVPSLRQSVAALDPSPPDHRCKHCSGRLLRGPQSAVCVYCGGIQPRDTDPEPIAFRSTVGCGWLLNSLALDGSEIVEPSIDKQNLNRGHSTPKDKVPLSDLLNLEIRWLAEPEIIERSLSNNASQSQSLTNLGAVDLDNLFTLSKDLISDLEEQQAVRIRQTEDVKFNAFAGQENRGFSSMVRHPVTEVTSSEVKGNDNFSGWEADFQSNSSSVPEPLKSPGLPISSTANLSTHMDSVIESGENLKNNKPKDVSSHVPEQVDKAIEVKDHTNDVNASPSSGWFPDQGNIDCASSSSAQDLSKSFVSARENEPTTGDDYSSDVWDEFTTSSNALDPPQSSFAGTEIKPINVDDESSDVWDDFTRSSNAQDPFKGSFAVTGIKTATGDDDLSDAWDGFTSYSNAHDPTKSFFATTEIKASLGHNNLSDVLDGLTSSSNAHDSSQSCVTITDNKPTNTDDSFDVWDGLTSFSNACDSSKTSTGVDVATDSLKSTITASGIKTTAGVDDSSDAWAGFTNPSNAYDPFESSNTFTDNKPTTVVDDSSDFWGSFTSSSNAHDPFKSSITATDNKSTTDVDYSSDVWDDFTSSSDVQNPSKTSSSHGAVEIAAAGEQTLDTMFPRSAVSFQEKDFGSSSQSADVLSGLVSDKNGHVEVSKMQSEVSTSNRLAGDEVKAGDAIIASKGADGPNSVPKSQEDTERLYSQMHDLSFMLKTEISVPSTKDDPSPSQDLRPSS